MTTFRLDYFDDSHRAEPGDLVTTDRLCYRVLAVRPVESRIWNDRWALTLERLGPLPVDPSWVEVSKQEYGSCEVVQTLRYRPGETAQDHARDLTRRRLEAVELVDEAIASLE
jgi:hypothetical protein